MSAPPDADLAGEKDYFCWLLDRAMPWAEGSAAVLETYFDASKRDGGTLCVAGFAFGSIGAKQATQDWIGLWGDTRCHMTDLNSKPEKHYGWSSQEAGDRLKRSVEIIKEHALMTVAVSCSMDEVRRLAPTSADPGSTDILSGFRTAYAICTHAAMFSLADLVHGNIDIAYFFESGDQYQAESQRFIARVNTFPDAAKYSLQVALVHGPCEGRLPAL